MVIARGRGMGLLMGMGSPFGVLEMFWTWTEGMVATNTACVLCATEPYTRKRCTFLLCDSYFDE